MYVDQEFDYYYGEQIKNYIAQFAQVFSEMYVTVGKNDHNADNNYVRIPMVYGSPDKVVSSIKSEHTQNKPLRLPIFAIKLDNLGIDLDRKVGTNVEWRETFLPLGGDIKNDLKVVYRLKPLPYTLTFAISAMASNSNQMFQIIEQILILFDPLLQFQTSDSYQDWTKIVDAELVNVVIDDNRNLDSDGRILQTTFTFDVKCYMSPPANIKKNAITKIRLRIDAVATADNFQDYLNDPLRPPLSDYQVIYDVTGENIPPI